MKLSAFERLQLNYLARQPYPVWGGHLWRGEPISDPDMRRWLELGLIEIVPETRDHKTGYRITEAGRASLKPTHGGE